MIPGPRPLWPDLLAVPQGPRDSRARECSLRHLARHAARTRSPATHVSRQTGDYWVMALLARSRNARAPSGCRSRSRCRPNRHATGSREWALRRAWLRRASWPPRMRSCPGANARRWTLRLASGPTSAPAHRIGFASPADCGIGRPESICRRQGAGHRMRRHLNAYPDS